MAKDSQASEAIPLLFRRCQFCRPVPAFHGKCTDPFGRKQECYCYAASGTHRYQWDGLTGDLEHDGEKDRDDGLPHDKDIREWEEERQKHEDRIMARD